MAARVFRLDQPQPHDIVGDPLLLAGVGGGFEATIDIRVLDGTGAVLLEDWTMSTNLPSSWQESIALSGTPPTTQGVVEVGPSTGADEAPPRVSVPIYFGTAIVPGFRSFYPYTVQSGDTLSSIAADQDLYTGSGWEPIFEANRHLIPDPGRIYPGTVLRLPSDF